MANSTTETETTDDLTEQETSPPISLEVPSSGLFEDASILHVASDDGGTLTGTDGLDIMVGSAGDDDFTGGDGDDVLVGGAGTNVLTGEGGNDIFGHAAGAVDIITDFAPTQDERLALADGLTVASSEQQTVDVDLGGGITSQQALVLTISDGSVVALLGVTDSFSTDWLLGSAGA